jgi:hypothetical protein
MEIVLRVRAGKDLVTHVFTSWHDLLAYLSEKDGWMRCHSIKARLIGSGPGTQ